MDVPTSRSADNSSSRGEDGWFGSRTRPPSEPGVGAPDSRALPQRAAPVPQASPDAALIRRTMAELTPVADEVTSYFYALLFVRYPGLRPLFPLLPWTSSATGCSRPC